MLTDLDLASLPATAGAQWLKPSEWPTASDPLFVPRAFDTTAVPAVISRYADVRDALLNVDRTWTREIPNEVIPPEARHRTLYAAWGATDRTPQHTMLRTMLNPISRGYSEDARAAIRDRARELLHRLLAEPQPWDLARVIYPLSMWTIIEYVIGAPQLHLQARRLRELARDHVTAPGGFFGITRQPEAEEILGQVVKWQDELPPNRLARQMVDRHLTDPIAFTHDQLVGQLWMLTASFETQATATASMIGLLLEFGELDFARSVLDDPPALHRLIEECLRLGIVFPVSMAIATKPFELDGQPLAPGSPCLISYVAANRDPAAFDDPLSFDPRAERTNAHQAFGVGPHHCNGEKAAEHFMSDFLREALAALPTDISLVDGRLNREVLGISLAVAELPVTSG
jgi:cytochrome P450